MLNMGAVLTLAFLFCVQILGPSQDDEEHSVRDGGCLNFWQIFAERFGCDCESCYLGMFDRTPLREGT